MTEYARICCRSKPELTSPVHAMNTEAQALCGAAPTNKSQEWEEVEAPLEHEVCILCWRIKHSD